MKFVNKIASIAHVDIITNSHIARNQKNMLDVIPLPCGNGITVTIHPFKSTRFAEIMKQ